MKALLFAFLGLVLVGVNTAATLGKSDAHAQSADTERVIKVVARRFSYSPNEIVLKRGEPVRLEFTSLDFVHGFKIPDLGIRADLPPDKTTSVRLQPPKNGRYAFLCDNFCGAEHEEMHGNIIVQD